MGPVCGLYHKQKSAGKSRNTRAGHPCLTLDPTHAKTRWAQSQLPKVNRDRSPKPRSAAACGRDLKKARTTHAKTISRAYRPIRTTYPVGERGPGGHRLRSRLDRGRFPGPDPGRHSGGRRRIGTTHSPITRDTVEQLERCGLIIRYGHGYEGVDLDACTEQGIMVANVPGSTSEEVSNHALALMFACAREVKRLDRATTEGQWGEVYSRSLGQRIFGQTAGVVRIRVDWEIVRPQGKGDGHGGPRPRPLRRGMARNRVPGEFRLVRRVAGTLGLYLDSLPARRDIAPPLQTRRRSIA